MLCLASTAGEGCWRVTVGHNHSQGRRRPSGFAVAAVFACSTRLGTSLRKARRAEPSSRFSPPRKGPSAEPGSSTCFGAIGRRSRPGRAFALCLPICVSSGAPTSPTSSSPKENRSLSLRRCGTSFPNLPLAVLAASCSRASIISTQSSTIGSDWNAGKRLSTLDRLYPHIRVLPGRVAQLRRLSRCTDSPVSD